MRDDFRFTFAAHLNSEAISFSLSNTYGHSAMPYVYARNISDTCSALENYIFGALLHADMT